MDTMIVVLIALSFVSVIGFFLGMVMTICYIIRRFLGKK